MRARLLNVSVAIAAVAVSALAGAGPVWANDPNGQYGWTAAQASGGQLTVQAGHTYWTPPAGSSWANEGKSDPPPSTSGPTNPDQPYGCTYTAQPSAAVTLGVGGAQPGEWVFPECAGPGAIDPMPPVWVTGAQPNVSAVQVNPVVVGQQAVKQLGFGSPMIQMAPPDGSPQLVGVAAWLWIDSGEWQTLTASATAGPVTATATATPAKVVWDMGDGDTVTCNGPGTAYTASNPNATTDCSYTWPSPGSFSVTATVYWNVTWTATGAPGGGNLGLQAGPPATVGVTVTESQAINTPTGSN